LSNKRWEIPWWAGNYWDVYEGIGHVNLGGKSGDLIATSSNWTVEVIFAMPFEHPFDYVDQFVWGFTKSIPHPHENMLAFNWREMYMRIRKSDAGSDYGFASDSWGSGIPYRELPKAKWAHLVVTKDSTGKITSYINGTKMYDNTVPSFPTFEEGQLDLNTFGRSFYIDPYNIPASGAVGNDLERTGLYHFAIDNTAWDASKVTTRYTNSAVGKNKLTAWEPPE
jgi:hypothetical protein